MRHVCAPKFCLLLTAVMSNDVGAAAGYPSTPRPIMGTISCFFIWKQNVIQVYCNLPAAVKQSAARRDMLLMQATEVLVESARFRYFHHSLTYKRHIYSAKRIWSMRLHLRQKMYNTQSNAKHLLFQFDTSFSTPEFDIANKPGTMMPCMTSLPNKGAQTQLWIGNV